MNLSLYLAWRTGVDGPAAKRQIQRQHAPPMKSLLTLLVVGAWSLGSLQAADPDLAIRTRVEAEYPSLLELYQ